MSGYAQRTGPRWPCHPVARSASGSVGRQPTCGTLAHLARGRIGSSFGRHGIRATAPFGLGADGLELFNHREVVMASTEDEETVRRVRSQPVLETRIAPLQGRAPSEPTPGPEQLVARPRASGGAPAGSSRRVPAPDIRCPKCQGRMRPYARSGLLVEMCEDCRGMFLDQGELERLIDAEGGGWSGIVEPFDLLGEPIATCLALPTRTRRVRARVTE